jgi:hypothetical protein
MSWHTCNSLKSNSKMSWHTCNSLKSNSEMSWHTCNSLKSNSEMSWHTCSSLKSNSEMSWHTCNSSGWLQAKCLGTQATAQALKILAMHGWPTRQGLWRDNRKLFRVVCYMCASMSMVVYHCSATTSVLNRAALGLQQHDLLVHKSPCSAHCVCMYRALPPAYITHSCLIALPYHVTWQTPHTQLIVIATCDLQDPHSDAACTGWPHSGHLQGLR